MNLGTAITDLSQILNSMNIITGNNIINIKTGNKKYVYNYYGSEFQNNKLNAVRYNIYIDDIIRYIRKMQRSFQNSRISSNSRNYSNLEILGIHILEIENKINNRKTHITIQADDYDSIDNIENIIEERKNFISGQKILGYELYIKFKDYYTELIKYVIDENLDTLKIKIPDNHKLWIEQYMLDQNINFSAYNSEMYMKCFISPNICIDSNNSNDFNNLKYIIYRDKKKIKR